MQPHKIVSEKEWLAARKDLLAKEKEFTRARDALSAERRALPWVKVKKPYVFDTPQGAKTLAELFAGKSQLIIYHFMLGPGWDEGCPSCSYLADHFDGATIHLANRDTAFVVVSRAPLAEIQTFKKRMGWHFPWVSSFGSDFNFDYKVSFSTEELAKGEIYNNYDSVEDPAYQNDELPGARKGREGKCPQNAVTQKNPRAHGRSAVVASINPGAPATGHGFPGTTAN